MGLVPTRLEDHVTVIEQQKTIEAVVEIDRHPQGYEITLVELPPHVEVTIESQLGSSLLSLCKSVSFFLGNRAACEGLERRLTHPQLALPERGTVFIVDAEYLSVPERQRLESYLGAPAAVANLSISPPASRNAPLP